jgi:hypothetical protein
MNLNQKKNNAIWLIIWQDAHSGSGWFYDKDVEHFINKEQCICHTVGWILNETKDEIVIASRKMRYTEDGDSQWGMLQKIPKAWIKKKVIYNDLPKFNENQKRLDERDSHQSYERWGDE